MENERRNKKYNWRIAILFSALLPLFGILNNIENGKSIIITYLPAWFVTFTFLMVAWFMNLKLSNLFSYSRKKRNLFSRLLIIFALNGLLLATWIIIGSFVADGFDYNRETKYIFIFFRGIASIAMIMLIQYTLNLNARNQTVVLQNQMLKTENIRAQFEILRQQISPHFLFNSLSTLRSMIRSSNKNAENFVIKLSDIYRLLLLNKERDTVTLKEELDLIEDYTFLLFARYENMLDIAINIPEFMFNHKIPSFTLQLLLENCVKHNIVSKEKPLHIKIYDSGINYISVENNIQPKVIVM
jgi:sensor histidine kinase YesM